MRVVDRQNHCNNKTAYFFRLSASLYILQLQILHISYSRLRVCLPYVTLVESNQVGMVTESASLVDHGRSNGTFERNFRRFQLRRLNAWKMTY